MNASDFLIAKVLMNSGIHKVQPNGSTGEEWFQTDIVTVMRAIKSVKEGRDSIVPTGTVAGTAITPIDFREEQLDAVEKTLKAFKKDNEMLWYAKMRFGKTLTALEVIRRKQYRRVIIVTHRPVVDDGWSEDFKKVFFEGNSEHSYHYERKTKDSAYTFDEKTDAENDLKIKKLDKNGDYFIYFASIQDLRGSKLVGGNFNKNNAVFALNWDLIVIDEAHEGTQTELGDNVIKQLRKEKTKVLALSGTPFNLLNQFSEDNVYTWDYVMEQKKKTEWDLLHHGDHNPYADLPKMHIYTYDLGEKLKKYVSDEYDTKAFNFREFFRVWSRGPMGRRELPKGAVEGKFVHENDIISFLNLMATEDKDSGYPFSTQEYLQCKFTRFLIRTTFSSVHISQGNFIFAPQMDFSRHWTDRELYSFFALTDEEVELIESTMRSMTEPTYYTKLLDSSYEAIVQALNTKYGAARHNYFKDTGCTIKNPLVSRTDEGLYCHHIDEDKAIMLSNDKNLRQ